MFLAVFQAFLDGLGFAADSKDVIREVPLWRISEAAYVEVIQCTWTEKMTEISETRVGKQIAWKRSI